MEDRNEEKGKCKKCKAKIDKKYDYCPECNKKFNIEIGVINKFKDDLPRTISYYKLILLDMFRRHDRIIMSFIKDNTFIADKIIIETNYFYLQEQRYSITKKIKDSPQVEIEIIKAPLYLCSQVKLIKKDRESRQLRWDD